MRRIRRPPRSINCIAIPALSQMPHVLRQTCHRCPEFWGEIFGPNCRGVYGFDGAAGVLGRGPHPPPGEPPAALLGYPLRAPGARARCASSSRGCGVALNRAERVQTCQHADRLGVMRKGCACRAGRIHGGIPARPAILARSRCGSSRSLAVSSSERILREQR